MGRKVLLLGWDSADWQIIQPLLDRGEMPHLERLINAGAMGNLSSLRPMLSPMLWNAISTGKRPFKHGVHGFTEVDPELNRVVPVSSGSRSCAALWQILNHAGLKTQVVGWFATHPAEPLDGVCVSDQYGSPAPAPGADWTLGEGTVYPPRLAETLAELRMRPEEVPADVLALFVREFAQVNQANDKRLHHLAQRLAECFSTHAAATYLLEHEPWDFAAVYYRAIDWICHDFMTFHPPRLAGVYDHEYRLYHDVVNSAYRLHDLFLGRLLQLAGGDATVLLVSDHGFKSDHRRPRFSANIPAGIAAWHRPNGIFAIRGAGVREDELVHGASILDVTPTILALFGLPVGADMDGRVLREVFVEPPEVERVESWDSRIRLTGDEKMRRSSPEKNAELIRQFVALGYIADPGDNPEEAIRTTERENRWNLAQSYLEAARFADALPLLEAAFEEWPERSDYCIELALCQFNLGLREEAEETLATLPEAQQQSPGVKLLRAGIQFRSGNIGSALEFLAQAEALDPKLPGLQNQIGLARLRLQQPELAAVAFTRALALEPEDASAHLGLAFCELRARRYEEAAEAALRAVGFHYQYGLAHYALGVALARLGETERAVQAFETCLRYQPSLLRAHRYLGVLLQKLDGGGALAAKHRERLSGRMERQAVWARFRETMRVEARERARLRADARRRRREEPAAAPSEKSPRGSRRSESLDFLLVSGLPRSGTSLMMQMLEAGGLAIMRDDLRLADEGNPRGYFEWQEIKKLPGDPYLIEQTHGRVTKVISMLLPSLPRRHRFRVIFMNRAVEDVAASQKIMRARLAGESGTELDPMHLQEHRARMLALLRQSENVELLEVDYDALLSAPAQEISRVAEFAGIGVDKYEAMRAAIDPALRHSIGAAFAPVV